ncbi:hypothetical protein ACHAXT_004639 [Thalassiosira profunda]
MHHLSSLQSRSESMSIYFWVAFVLPLLPAIALSMTASQYTLRRYQSSDLAGAKKLFADNIREEWRDTYHGGKYAENAERYIRSVVAPPDSDMNTIEETYFGDTGGYFWVLTCSNNDGEEVVGTCGLQRVDSSTAEIRRMCLAKQHRRKGWGTKMLQIAIQHAATKMSGVDKLVVSTIEHSIEGIDFYKTKNGFVDTIDEGTGVVKRSPVHGTPIREVFMEYQIIGKTT